MAITGWVWHSGAPTHREASPFKGRQSLRLHLIGSAHESNQIKDAPDAMTPRAPAPTSNKTAPSPEQLTTAVETLAPTPTSSPSWSPLGFGAGHDRSELAWQMQMQWRAMRIQSLQHQMIEQLRLTLPTEDGACTFSVEANYSPNCTNAALHRWADALNVPGMIRALSQEGVHYRQFTVSVDNQRIQVRSD